MDTIGKLVEHVSGQLNDQQQFKEYLRWNRGLLVDYYTQALTALRQYRIDAFTTTLDVTLKPGSRQTVEGFSGIIAINGNADGSPAVSTDAQMLKAFAAFNTCAPKLQRRNGKLVYNVRSVGIDKTDPKVFYVSPAVPVGMAPVVSVTAVRDIRTYTLADWDKPLDFDAKYINQIIDFMQARAYELDIEARTSKMDAERFYTHFYRALGINYKMESAFGSGFYKGQTGMGDPRAVVTT